jgi:hypothetical protein
MGRQARRSLTVEAAILVAVVLVLFVLSFVVDKRPEVQDEDDE